MRVWGQRVVRKRWWCDVGIWLGLASILATGITYWLNTESQARDYKERTKTARTQIIGTLERNIYEGNGPTTEIIVSAIDSANRQYGIRPQDSENILTVINDLVARVNANGALDKQKKKDLSEKLLKQRKLFPPDRIEITSVSNSWDATPLFVSLLTLAIAVGIFRFIQAVKPSAETTTPKYAILLFLTLSLLVFAGWMTYLILLKKGISLQIMYPV